MHMVDGVSEFTSLVGTPYPIETYFAEVDRVPFAILVGCCFFYIHSYGVTVWRDGKGGGERSSVKTGFVI